MSRTTLLRGAAPPTPATSPSTPTAAPADAAPSPEAAVDEATAQLDAMERRADRRPTLRPASRVRRQRALPVENDAPEPREPGEIGVYVRSFHHGESFGVDPEGIDLGGDDIAGYHGDGRGFSTDREDTARIRAGVVFREGEGGFQAARAGGRSDESGNDLLRFLHPGQYPNETGVPEVEATARQPGGEVTLRYAGSMPLHPSFDIDVDARMRVERTGERTIRVTLAAAGDGFPNAEAFARDHAGNAVFLGVHQLQEGQIAADLAGEAETPMFSASLQIHTREDGTFEAVEFGGERYTLEEWNARFEEMEPVGEGAS